MVPTEMIDEDELRQELDDLLVTNVDSDMSSTPLQPQTSKFGMTLIALFIISTLCALMLLVG